MTDVEVDVGLTTAFALFAQVISTRKSEIISNGKYLLSKTPTTPDINGKAKVKTPPPLALPAVPVPPAQNAPPREKFIRSEPEASQPSKRD